MARLFRNQIGFVAFAALLAGAGPVGAQQAGRAEQINIVGVSVYEPAEILGYAAKLVAQRTGSVEPGALALTVAQIYREDGYFLAEVSIAGDGRTLVVDEGRIDTISIEGIDASTYRLAERYMRPILGRPALNQREFERAIMLVEDIGSTDAVAEIDYPDPAAGAHLRVIGTPVDRDTGFVKIDHPSRQFGEAAILSFGQEFHDALTAGDMLRFELSAGRNFDVGSDSVWGALFYRVPVGDGGGFIETYLGDVTARWDATASLQATDFDGNTAILAFGYPVIRNVDTYGYAILDLRETDSEVDVSGTVFDSGVRAVGASWIYGHALPHGGALEYAVNVTYGSRTGASVSFDDGDDDFSYIRAGFGYERPVDWFGPDSSFRFDLWGQATNDRLPGVEQFFIGGREDERGYFFAEATGDSGISASFEVSRDLFPQNAALRRIRPFGFFDVGTIRNNRPSVTELSEETFASIGVGIDAEFASGFFTRAYVAAPLRDGPDTDAGDPAIYLSLTKSW